MIEIEVTSENYNCRCRLERSVTIITGLSGVGKTVLASHIADYKENDTSDLAIDNCASKEKVSISIEGAKLAVTIMDNSFLSAIYDQFKVMSFEDYVCPYTNRLFVADDDCTLVKHGEFTNFLKKALPQGCYFLIVTHDLNPVFNNIHCSLHSVLKMEKLDDENRVIVPYYPLTCVSDDDIFEPDLIVVEDSGDGLDWFRTLYKGISCETTKGKRDFIGKFTRNADVWRDKKILFIFDTAAYGIGFKSLITVLQLYNYKLVRIIPSYECFEYLLLSSNLLCNFDGNLVKSTELCNFANKFFTWEQFFEHHLEELTAGTCFQYKHLSPKDLKGLPEDKKKALQYEYRFRKCYFKNCSDVSNEDYCRGKSCEQFIETLDKFDHMLKGTEFECLLDYRKDTKLK